MFFKERFSPRFLIGLAVALSGMVLLVLGGDRSLAVNDWLGLMLATLGAIGYAGYLRGVKAARASVGLAQVMFWTSACTALWLLPAALLTEDKVVPHTLEGWLAVGGLAIISQIIGQGMISWALGLLPAAFSSVSLLVNPVASGIFAWIILGEALIAIQIGGGLAVLAGIFVARPNRRFPPQRCPRTRSRRNLSLLRLDPTGPAHRVPGKRRGDAVTDDRDLLQRMFAAAIGAVDPLKILAPDLPAPPKGRTIVVGAGKAAAAMAKAVEDDWPGAARRPGRHALRPRPAVPAHRGGRGGASGAGRRRPAGGAAHPGHGRRA